MSSDPKSSPPTPGHDVVEVLETVIEIIEPGQGDHQYSVVGAEPNAHDPGHYAEVIETVADPTADAHVAHVPGLDHDHQVDFIEVIEVSPAASTDAEHDAVIVVHDVSTDHHDDCQGD